MSMNKVVITLAAILTMTAAEASYAYPTAIYGEDGITYRLESVKHSGEYMTAEYKAESEAPITIEKLKSNMPFPREAYKIPDDKANKAPLKFNNFRLSVRFWEDEWGMAGLTAYNVDEGEVTSIARYTYPTINRSDLNEDGHRIKSAAENLLGKN